MDRIDGPEAARRQVTVLFCDIVGSTELGNALDPEDMAEILGGYRDACAGAIARFEGFVARFMGDGVLAYFGYPQAHEEDAERSVRAALAIVERVAKVKRPDGRGLEVRIGIATGVVVIGDIIGSGIAREHSVVGETPNLAARLQGLADPNAILVAQSTHSLLGTQFDYRALGECKLKGFASPVPVWQVLGEVRVESRFEARRAPRAAPFVGREPQLLFLLDRWERARRGAGQAVLLAGDAGIGKSRLVDSFSAKIADSDYHRVFCQCSPYHANSALHPLTQYLERAADFAPSDSVATKLDKLEALFGKTGPRAEQALALVADLLSLPDEGRYAPLELLPAQRKAATIVALVERVTRLAERGPVLFVLEDAHWVDPSTREVVARLVDGTRSAPVLAIITSRPDPDSARNWGERVELLALGRLTRSDCVEMVGGITVGDALKPELVDDILRKTDGVPLFVEEITRSVLESTTSQRSTVPATLHDSLMGRLDRLGTAREIAQVAAVIGQPFSYRLLEAVAAIPPGELAVAIERLVEGGLFLREDHRHGSSGSFKHALLRDVAYESLLRPTRQQLHERVARAIESGFPSMVQAEPEMLAYHFAQAAMPGPACAHFELAGDRAAARTAYAEAIAHFRAGLVEAGRLAPGPERSQRELKLLLKLGPTLALLVGSRHPEVEELYRRAQAIAESLKDESAYFKSTWGLWFTAHVSRNVDTALARAEELVALGRESSDADQLLEAIHCRWATSFIRGDVTASLADSREGVERYDPARHAWMGAVFGGHDPGVCAHVSCAGSLALAGCPEPARKNVDRALALAESLRHPPSLSQAYQTAMVTYQLIGDPAAVRGMAKRMLALADKYDFTPQHAHARFMDGWAIAASEPNAGIDAMEAEFASVSSGTYFRYYAALLAEALLRSGRTPEAHALILTALATVTKPGVGFYVPELYRLQGECLLRLDEHHLEEAVRAMQMAIDTAREHGALLLEQKATAGLAHARGLPA